MNTFRLFSIVFLPAALLSAAPLQAAQPAYTYVNEQCMESGFVFKWGNCTWDGIEPNIFSEQELVDMGVSMGPGTRDFSYIDREQASFEILIMFLVLFLTNLALPRRQMRTAQL